MIPDQGNQSIQSRNSSLPREALNQSDLNFQIRQPQPIINHFSEAIPDDALRAANQNIFGIRTIVLSVIITAIIIGCFSVGFTYLILSNRQCSCNQNNLQNFQIRISNDLINSNESLNACLAGWKLTNQSLGDCISDLQNSMDVLSIYQIQWSNTNSSLKDCLKGLQNANSSLINCYNGWKNTNISLSSCYNTICPDNKAICENHPAYSIPSALYLTVISCSGCIGWSCSFCTDKNNLYQGYSCKDCITLNGQNGYCSSCQVCTPVSTIAICKNYYRATAMQFYTHTPYLAINQISCSGCDAGSCTSCIDKYNGKVGYRCSNCIDYGSNKKGYCSHCYYCTNFIGIITCQNYPYSRSSFLNINTTTCSGCSGNTCTVCQDKATGVTGRNCRQCDNLKTTYSSVWYCNNNCQVCVPVLAQAACHNYPTFQFATLILNQSSCNNCNDAGCAQCIDQTNNSRIGKNCINCKIINLKTLTGYCTGCLICSLIQTLSIQKMQNTTVINASCNNYPSSIAFAIALHNNSCYDCENTSCAYCLDQNNGNIAYNCNGCTIISNNTGYCNQCTTCTPVLVNSQLMALNESSCSGCSEYNCTSCTDYNNGITNFNCYSCTIIKDNKGYCDSCSINSLTMMFSQFAFCQNYFLLPFQFLSINSTSCSGCSNSYCDRCFDAYDHGITGTDCTHCKFIQGTNLGSCTHCTFCTVISIFAYCQVSTTSLNNLTLNSVSCSGCNRLTCIICKDINNGIVGTNCINCKITENTNGYCKQCATCKSLAISSFNLKCYRGPQNIIINQTSCSGCFGDTPYTRCTVCVDINDNNITGVVCAECTITSGSNGYCGFCSICNSGYTPIYCYNNYTDGIQYPRLYVNYSSCTNCSGCVGCFNQYCSVCTDLMNSSKTAYNCSNCFIISNGTGYCTICDTCSF